MHVQLIEVMLYSAYTVRASEGDRSPGGVPGAFGRSALASSARVRSSSARSCGTFTARVAFSPGSSGEEKKKIWDPESGDVEMSPFRELCEPHFQPVGQAV